MGKRAGAGRPQAKPPQRLTAATAAAALKSSRPCTTGKAAVYLRAEKNRSLSRRERPVNFDHGIFHPPTFQLNTWRDKMHRPH